MATPNLSDLFPGAQVIEATGDITGTLSTSAPGLFIPWSFFSAQGVDNVDTLDSGEAVLGALINAPYEWYRTDTTEQPAIEYDPMRKTVLNRNGEDKFAFQHGITLYQSYTAPTFDPDLLA